MDSTQDYLFQSFRLSAARRELWADGVPVSLGTRAFDVLLALVRRHGQLATKNELMAEVWPGTVVEENNLTTHIATLRRLLGEGEASRFILTVPGRGYRFVAAVTLAGEAVEPEPPPAPPPRSHPAPVAPLSNLPAHLTNLIGRVQVVLDIVERLGGHRLVTITGAGGVGKTRVAIEAAGKLTERFPDGVQLIEFAPLGDPQLVGETVARALNLPVPAAADATRTVTSFLKAARILLVFDNCEHLIEAISQLANAILQASASVAILATSRERLRLAGESVYQLPPLAVPNPLEDERMGSIAHSAAVELFLDRAASAVEGFSLHDGNRAAVATICRRLDGIPFAIELAVPWLRMLSPDKLAAKLDDRFRVLTRGSRGTLPHHQTLKGLIGWSYQLLSDFERAALDRLSVFPASFSAEGAVAAIGCDHGDEFECLNALASLVDKSLVMAQPGGAESRYRLLETTWAYAEEQLGASGRVEALARVALFIAEVFAAAERSWPTTATSIWRARYEPELEILRHVLGWAFGKAGDSALGVQLVAASNWFWEELGLVAERARWLKTACDAIDDTTPRAVEGKIRLGLNYGGSIGHGGAESHLNETVEIFRQLNEPIYLALALRQRAAIKMRPGDVAEPERWLAEAESLLRPLGPSKPLCGVLDIRSTARLFADDAAGCRILLEQTLAMARDLDYPRQIEVATLNLAELEFDQGHAKLAINHLEHTIKSCLASGNLRTLCGARTNMAGYLLAAGDLARALPQAREALRLAVSIDDHMVGLQCIEHVALIAARRGDRVLAENLVRFGDAQYARLGISRAGVEAVTREALEQCFRAAARSANNTEPGAPVWDFELAAEAALKGTD